MIRRVQTGRPVHPIADRVANGPKSSTTTGPRTPRILIRSNSTEPGRTTSCDTTVVRLAAAGLKILVGLRGGVGVGVFVGGGLTIRMVSRASPQAALKATFSGPAVIVPW